MFTYHVRMPTTWSWPDARITRVIDGDSFTARLTRDIGFHGVTIFDQRLRLNRINTPPVKTPEGKSAATFFEALVRASDVTSPPLLIETIKPYKYGDEWMAEVTLPDGRNVSDLMVSAGGGQYWDGTGPRPGG
jgi:endonuclease YncB( thermonuclease family)